MQPGPPPKLALARKQNGNAGKRKINENEPKPELQKELPKRPNWLKGEGKKEWDRIIEDVFKTGVLARIDVSLLADYCQLQGDFVDSVRRREARSGSLITQTRALAALFGIGPAERSRLKVPSDNQTDKEEKRFFG